MSNEEVYLRHILEAIEKIGRYTKDLSSETFRNNDLVADGVVRELEIIGEASAHLDEAFRQQHADIPFAEIVGMRNRLIHEYFGVNLDLVWKTVTDNLPLLREKIRKLLS